MRAFFWFKILLMLGALVGVVYIIVHLNSESVGEALGAIGVETGGASLHASEHALQAGEERFNLCPTRIHAVSWPNGHRIEEQRDGMKMKWMAIENPGGAKGELGYLEVEKWLSQHCQVTVLRAAPSELTAMQEVAKIEYIDGSVAKIESSQGGSLVMEDPGHQVKASFGSPDLLAALAELEQVGRFSH